MDGLRDCHTEWSKSNREIEISYDITYADSQKMIYKWTYFQNRNRLREKFMKYLPDLYTHTRRHTYGIISLDRLIDFV